MSQQQASDLVVKIVELATCFPNREISEATIVAYTARLSAYPLDLVVPAMDHLAETVKWFPPIAEILDAAGLGGTDAPPFVLTTGPIGHPPTVALWRARLRRGQQLRFDREHCRPSPPKDETERLIWLCSINRAAFPDYNGDTGYRRWRDEVADMEHAVGVPLVQAIGRGGR